MLFITSRLRSYINLISLCEKKKIYISGKNKKSQNILQLLTLQIMRDSETLSTSLSLYTLSMSNIVGEHSPDVSLLPRRFPLHRLVFIQCDLFRLFSFNEIQDRNHFAFSFAFVFKFLRTDLLHPHLYLWCDFAFKSSLNFVCLLNLILVDLNGRERERETLIQVFLILHASLGTHSRWTSINLQPLYQETN